MSQNASPPAQTKHGPQNAVDMMIVGSPSLVAFFFFPVPPPAPLFFFGVSTAVAVGVPAVVMGVSGAAPASPSSGSFEPGTAAFGFGADFFLAALAVAGMLLSTCPSGPSFVCTVEGASSGITICCAIWCGGGGGSVGCPNGVGAVNGMGGSSEEVGGCTETVMVGGGCGGIPKRD